MFYNAVLFFIYKLYQWAGWSDPDSPMFGVTVGVVVFNTSGLFSIANIIYMATGLDILDFMEIFESKIEFLPFGIAWFAAHYLVLEKGNLKKASLEKFLNKDLPKYGSLWVLLVIGLNVMLFCATTVFRMGSQRG
jgi:hypothetical protein